MLELLQREWSPCTAGRTIYQHIAQDSAGPFLRSLAYQWNCAGRPYLPSLHELQVGGGFNLTPSLNDLADQQDIAIAELVRIALQDNTGTNRPKPFEAFAAQLGLYSSIKADLQGSSYNDVWQNVLQNMDYARSQTCSQNSHHLCLGQVLFGEAYRWPLRALQVSFQGYTVQLQTSRLIPEILQEMGTDLAGSSSVSSSGEGGSGSTPATTLTEETSQASMAGLLRRWSKSSSHKSQFEVGENRSQLIAMFDSETYVPTSSQVLTNSVLQSRRPTLSDFWDVCTMPFLQAADVASNALPSDDDLVSTTSARKYIDDPISYFDEPANEGQLVNAGVKGSTPLPTPPLFALPLLQPTSFPKSKQIETPLLPEVDIQSIAGTSTQSVMPPSSIRKRPQMRKRSSTIESMGSQCSDKSYAKLHHDDVNSPSSRLRSQRHYAKLIAQRNAIAEVLKQLQRQTNRMSTGDIASTDKHITSIRCFFEEAEIASSSILSATALASSSEGSLSDPNKRKRDSKKKIRNMDIRNINLLNRIAGLLLETPLPRLCALVARSIHFGRMKVDTDLERDPLTTYVGVLLASRHAWPDLLAAEKRLLQDIDSRAKLITAFIGLLQIAYDEACSVHT